MADCSIAFQPFWNLKIQRGKGLTDATNQAIIYLMILISTIVQQYEALILHLLIIEGVIYMTTQLSVLAS